MILVCINCCSELIRKIAFQHHNISWIICWVLLHCFCVNQNKCHIVSTKNLVKPNTLIESTYNCKQTSAVFYATNKSLTGCGVIECMNVPISITFIINNHHHNFILSEETVINKRSNHFRFIFTLINVQLSHFGSIILRFSDNDIRARKTIDFCQTITVLPESFLETSVDKIFETQMQSIVLVTLGGLYSMF